VKTPGRCGLPQFKVSRHDVGVPGIEIVDAVNLPDEFRWFTTNYGITVPVTWSGDIVYRGRRYAQKPGIAFCNEPGEIVTTHRSVGVGSFRAFGFDPEAFREHLQEHGIEAAAPRWRLVTPAVSTRLSKQLGHLFRILQGSVTTMQLQSSAVEVFHVLLTELVDRAAPQPAPMRAGDRLAERIRECLVFEDEPSLDLETLSRKMGMSRFQILRTFKHRYGLPPHAYQLCVRIGRARELLKTGAPPADVAARFGFVDQSHFTRHFKRFVGVTPSRYARCEIRKSSLEQARVAEGGTLLAAAYRRDHR
jgi:AraC-like DNA-binding protein